MNKYGPIIVGVIFGAVMGAVFLMTDKILSGLFIWSLVVLVVAHALSPNVSTSLLIVTIAAVIYSAAFAYFAASSEMTGKAVHYHAYGRVVVGVPV